MNNMPRLTDKRILSCQKELDTSPNRLGALRRSDDVLGDFDAYRDRMNEDGYLFLPGFLDLNEVKNARLDILNTLNAEGKIDPSASLDEAVAQADLDMVFRPDIANNSAAVKDLVYSERVTSMYDGFLGGKARHYDFTWLRAVAPGGFTQPHYDIVYMGRGTKRNYTMWTPLSDIPYELGGLAILENSHRLEELKGTYGTMDVDTYCENKPDVMQMNDKGFTGFGALTDDPVEIAEKFDRRWLTAEYKMGDVLIFSMFTLHASTDNQTNRIRLSTDTRYQLEAEPADERWIGENPIGHGKNARKELIC